MSDYKAGPPPAPLSYPYVTDFILVPAIVAAVAWGSPPDGVRWWFDAFTGLVLLTLAEYIVHRWVLHWMLWYSTHQRHHTHPSEYQVFTWWQLPAIFILTWLVLPAPVYAGFLVGVFWFLAWHHALHHWNLDNKPLLAQYGRWHDLHHKDLPVNYGITNPLWDFVFGTYVSLDDGRKELLAQSLARQEHRARVRQAQNGWTGPSGTSAM